MVPGHDVAIVVGMHPRGLVASFPRLADAVYPEDDGVALRHSDTSRIAAPGAPFTFGPAG